MQVLFETEADGLTDGLTDNYIRIYTKEKVTCGELYEVVPTEIYRDGLLAKAAEK